MRGVAEKEWQIDHPEGRDEIDDWAVGDDARIDNAHLHPLQEGPFVSEFRVGEDGDRKGALGVFFHQFLELLGGHVEGVFLVHDVSQLDLHGKSTTGEGKHQYHQD